MIFKQDPNATDQASLPAIDGGSAVGARSATEATDSGSATRGTSRVHPEAGDLYRHVSAEKSSHYRTILDVFATAKRQYRLQLRPDEVLAEASWPDVPPRIEELNTMLTALVAWGNLESQADTARFSSLSDFYRARYVYRLSHGGEAVAAGLTVFLQTLLRRAELQSVPSKILPIDYGSF